MKEVYIFDFDETLMWAPRWYEAPVVDSDLYVINAEKSPAVQAGLDFIEKHQPNAKLKLTYRHKTLEENSDQNFYYVLTESNVPTPFSEISQQFHPDLLKKAFFEDYLDQVAILNDYLFYRNPETIGTLGVNADIKDIYLDNHHRAVVLTARVHLTPVEESIKNSLENHLKLPQKIIMRPDPELDAGGYKAKVIQSYLEDPEIDFVHFYDDDQEYLAAVIEMVNTSLYSHKIKVNNVSIQQKPKSPFFNLLGKST